MSAISSSGRRLLLAIALGASAGVVLAVLEIAGWPEDAWWYGQWNLMAAAIVYFGGLGLLGALAASIWPWEVERRAVGRPRRVAAKSFASRALSAGLAVAGIGLSNGLWFSPALFLVAAAWLIVTSAISFVGIRKDRTAILTA